jgi:CheY-like chemotaxis protein/Tfp pilus assembly protein PilF
MTSIDTAQETQKEPAELLGGIPRRVVIVDDERPVLMALERAFFDAGTKEVMCFEDGASAARIIASGAAVDAFILDWRLPDFGGLALLNRIRAQVAFDRTPVLVLSGFLDKRDFRLAAEFPLLALVEKPSHANYVFKKLGELFRERDFFDKEAENLAVEIQALVPRANFIDDRWERLRSRLRDAPRPAPVYFTAIRLLQRRQMDKMADILLQDLISLDPDCAVALIELGRKKIALGDMESAGTLLQRAALLAPRNLERLCLLGDVQIRMMRGPDAKKTFTEASSVDPKDERVVTGLQIATNMERHMREVDPSKLGGSLVALLNGIGVLMVRQGRMDEGVHHYQSALRFADNDSDWVRLGYNLGLAYMRWQKPLDASIWFKKAWERSKGTFLKAQKMFEEAMSEVRRLGIPIAVRTDPGSEGEYIQLPEIPINPGAQTGSKDGAQESGDGSGGRDSGNRQGAGGAGGRSLPPPEFPADLLAWDKIRKTLRTVRIPEPELFVEAGINDFRADHVAFGGLVGEKRVCILIPKSVVPDQVALMDEFEAREAGVKALRRTRKAWALMWPVGS